MTVLAWLRRSLPRAGVIPSPGGPNGQPARPGTRTFIGHTPSALTDQPPIGSCIPWPDQLGAALDRDTRQLWGVPGPRRQALREPQGVGRITMPKRASAAVTSEVGTAAVFTVRN